MTPPHILDISDTFDMVACCGVHDIALWPDILLWCHETFGYMPKMETEKISSFEFSRVSLHFRNEIDPTLFRIKYGDKWS